MIDFYGMEMSPPCAAAMTVMKLAGIEYKYHVIDLVKGDQLKPEFIKINPNHTG